MFTFKQCSRPRPKLYDLTYEGNHFAPTLSVLIEKVRLMVGKPPEHFAHFLNKGGFSFTKTIIVYNICTT